MAYLSFAPKCYNSSVWFIFLINCAFSFVFFSHLYVYDVHLSVFNDIAVSRSPVRITFENR